MFNINAIKSVIKHSLHAQSVLSHRFSAVLVTAGVLLKEEAFGEPERAVFTFAPGNQHSHHHDDHQEEHCDANQKQLSPLRHLVRVMYLLT